ncbi:hypothetical protein PsAD13_02630 [Pseudovibrio sp. Ad13]|uniref:hypothetical protein n=1 Tax=unclassified Pseudovibrio TaxID=2627060 RepID=UPI0007AECB7C|nr:MULTISPECIES: hypothetical protein [unclassified Pseudovibrio]KZK83580.1 hypothetical protein PsAD13_02630 [Pseudovibrio sp. Ad13]KZK95026.1 hypothetical protein PsW74_04287 [Pseudovibrio sp. W74]KZL08829.1 hypothetical protein PsAD14_02773 [Pseudovibrio sp. Ad14]KZL18444.1 hypothetical protein PsWM33_04847 [Pseudovibrio sp. WM33]
MQTERSEISEADFKLPTRADIIKLIDMACNEFDMTPAQLGQRAVGNPHLHLRLRTGADIRLSSLRGLVLFIKFCRQERVHEIEL